MQGNRFAFLDGIRGIAALFVVMRHTTEFWNFDFFRSYLAVDLFFILSGFVIGFAYDEKLKNKSLTVAQFMRIRLIRLYPLYFLSLLISILALVCTLSGSQDFNGSSASGITLVIALSVFFLPSQLGGSLLFFPINIPYWSLFYELVVNYVYAVSRPLLSGSRHIVVVGILGVSIAISAYLRGNLNAGFLWGYLSIFIGFSRSLFGILMGLLLFKAHHVFSGKLSMFLSPWVAVFAMCAILAMPSVGRLDGVIDMFAVTVLFPFLVLCASQPKRTILAPVLVALGTMSYPMYVLHEPLGKIIMQYWPDAVKLYAPFSGLVLTVLLAYACVFIDKCYDVPVRRLLSTRRVELPKLPA